MAPPENNRRSGEQSAQRTAKEREQARQERERARHARTQPQPQAAAAQPSPPNPVADDETEAPPAQPPVVEERPPWRPQSIAGVTVERNVLLHRRSRRLREDRAHSGHGPRLTGARAVVLAAIVCLAALLWFAISLFQPLHGSGHGRVIVDIPKGSSSSKIGSILARDGVVDSSFFFQVRALLEGKRSELHSGRFQMKKDMSYSAAIAALTKPPPASIPVRVLIPEGKTRLQISQLAREDGLLGDYLSASTRVPGFDPARYGAPSHTPNLEGFLFPATYDMNAGTPASRLVAEQLAAFAENFGGREIARARDLHITPYQLLIVASMVEREAQIPGDRAKIAAVIYNRLKTGMPLGIDATLYYAVELQKGIPTYTGELTETQLKIDSPYNTRTHHGLPPTPISNPGDASIHAAAYPAHVPYLYYVAGADGCGEQVFSTTYAKFEADASAYRAALAKNHGRPPVCKGK
jgi:UPF0755 protein